MIALTERNREAAGMEKKKLAIFDLDGTLFDTVPANFAAYESILGKHGFSLEYEHYAKNCNGRYFKDFLPELVGPDEELAVQIHEEKIAAYPQFYHKIRENRGLFGLLEALRRDYHIALVSTAARKSVYDILERFHRREVFDLILTQVEIPRQKPAPDGFQMAMAHFGVGPEDTVVFEDSPQGIAAAKACGAQCFVVKSIE